MKNQEIKKMKSECREYAKRVWQESLRDSKLISKILNNLEIFLKKHQGESIFAFYPMESELPILRIIEKLYKKIYIPVLEYNSQMSFALYKDSQYFMPLIKNRFGIMEPDINKIPRENTILYPTKNDIVVIPSLGINPFFARLGRGAGYYDKFFFHHKESKKALKISLIPKALINMNFVHEDHDLIMDIIITENNIVYK